MWPQGRYRHLVRAYIPSLHWEISGRFFILQKVSQTPHMGAPAGAGGHGGTGRGGAANPRKSMLSEPPGHACGAVVATIRYTISCGSWPINSHNSVKPAKCLASLDTLFPTMRLMRQTPRVSRMARWREYEQRAEHVLIGAVFSTFTVLSFHFLLVQSLLKSYLT